VGNYALKGSPSTITGATRPARNACASLHKARWCSRRLGAPELVTQLTVQDGVVLYSRRRYQTRTRAAEYQLSFERTLQEVPPIRRTYWWDSSPF